ncbi:MAG TPA: type I methionyl aminopeptidase [Candidatus Aphodoplasma excrementigallinarum]|uniref:Methionine aminopeptidase n=1 Tax=Candidatus Aphodoplasma excrementigallinarum TaxID=2840673 RepID=A0A9D1NGM2_9FIRM|nr:type I methionyl aminopeptidase [Candidatus Aphodoplasma excrementigallinarum]
MITIKSHKEVDLMRQAGKIVAGTFEALRRAVKPGVTTKELDHIAYDYIRSHGATPSFLNYSGFPASICASINDTVIHGIPDDTKLCEGDIISLDIGACYKGYHGDSAKTFPVGKISADAQRLIDVTRQSFYEGIQFATRKNRVGDISAAIGNYVEENGFSVVRDYTGHGVGRHLHEDPSILNFGRPGHGLRLMAGMTIAVEPMVNAGGYGVYVEDDDWTVRTDDGSLSAHYEHTILITDGVCEILTQ